ncbi:MAG: alpha/beta fold hydrolase [Ilumatobacteraceae bacterium]|jgi:pimeloyl-ACP methyl ester carboxylesterase
MTIDYQRPLAAPERIVTSSDGTRLSTVSMGSGTPVVLAHGFGLDMHCWNVVADDLVSKGLKVIAFDQRGHGRTDVGSEGVGSRQMVDDYLAVLRAYDVSNGILVGHSMGGFLAIRALIERPTEMARHLRGCVLMATFAGDINRKNLQNRIQIPMIQSGLMSKLIRSDTSAAFFAKSVIGDEKHPAMMNAFTATFRKSNLKQLVPILTAFVKEDRYDQLGNVSLPCRIVVGEKDKTTPPFHTDWLHKGIKGSTLKRIPKMGHMLNWESPEILVGEITALAR